MASHMAAESSQNARLRLTLDDTGKNDVVGNTTVVWNPANVLRGSLEITCERRFDINEVTIFLEGGKMSRGNLSAYLLRDSRDLEELGS